MVFEQSKISLGYDISCGITNDVSQETVQEGFVHIGVPNFKNKFRTNDSGFLQLLRLYFQSLFVRVDEKAFMEQEGKSTVYA